MNNAVVAVIVVVVIGIVGYLAYSQGYFQGKEEEDSGLNISIGGERGADGY